MSDFVLARNCCMVRMLPGEAELVSEWTGLPGRTKSVQRFERSDGPDTALYKTTFLYNGTMWFVWHIVTANINNRHYICLLKSKLQYPCVRVYLFLDKLLVYVTIPTTPINMGIVYLSHGGRQLGQETRNTKLLLVEVCWKDYNCVRGGVS